MVATTADPELTFSQLAEVVEHRDLIRVVECRWSYRELAALYERIGQDVRHQRDAAQRSSHVNKIEIAERSNVVEIGISAPDDALAEALTERYGADQVQVTVHEQSVSF